MSGSGRVLIGAVGYQNLGNHSIGPLLLPRLQSLSWPDGVQLEELSWGPVAVAQRLLAEEPPFDRVVLLGARPDSGLEEGSVSLYRWEGGLPEPAQIQARMGEAVSGVISVDNLLVVVEHLGAWPQQVYLVDVAPGPQRTGAHPTHRVASQIPRMLEAVRDAALFPAEELECLSLRGGDLGSRKVAQPSRR